MGAGWRTIYCLGSQAISTKGKDTIEASYQDEVAVSYTPFQGCLTPGRRQDKHHTDVRRRKGAVGVP